MIQRDLIKDQIEQMSRVLASVLGKMIGISEGVNIDLLEEIKAEINNELAIDIDGLLKLDDSIMLQLLDDHNFESQHYYQLAQILNTIASRAIDEEEQKKIFQQALILAQQSLDSSDVYDFEKVEFYSKLDSIINPN